MATDNNTPSGNNFSTQLTVLTLGIVLGLLGQWILQSMTGDTGDSLPKMEAPQIFVERTLAIIKPDAVPKSEEIEDIILRSGFSILQVGTYIICGSA